MDSRSVLECCNPGTNSGEPLESTSSLSPLLTQRTCLSSFTGGYIEVSIQLPGIDTVSVRSGFRLSRFRAHLILALQGFWPGAWTMGNLARAGYGATTDGTWP